MAEKNSTSQATEATIHSFEIAREIATLKKTPAARREKCKELLQEQAMLERRLFKVRSMIDAVVNTPYRATYPE